MAEDGTVTDPPVPAPAPKAADPSKSEVAFGSDTRPPPSQDPDPTPKTEPKAEAIENERKTAVASDAQTKKRKPGPVDELRNSAYFKIRSLLRDLRPFFIEVIHAPDFRECKAANDIQKQLKTMVQLSKQLRSEPSVAKTEKREGEPLLGANKGDNNVPQPQNGEVLSSLEKGTANVPIPDDKIPEVKEIAKQPEEGIHGPYVIGGSPVGWNFLVFLGSNPVYYGVTRESFRSRQTAK